MHSTLLTERAQLSRVYLRRWYILIVFALLSFTQSAWWITFSTVVPQVKTLYGIDEPAINLLLSWGMIVYVLVAPFAMYALAIPNGGLRWSVIASALVMLAGTLIRAIPSFFPKSRWAFVLLSAGQILVAAGGPVLGMAPPQVSARWFPADERTIATGIGVSFSNLGSGVAFLVGPLLVGRIGFEMFLWGTTGFTGLLCLITIIYFPDGPPLPPSISEGLLEHDKYSLKDFKVGIIQCFKNLSFMILIIVGAIQFGLFSSWTSIFDFLLIPTFTEETAGLLGFFYTLSNTVACVLGGIMVDKLFKNKFKLILMSFLGLTALFLALWTISFSNFLTPKKVPLVSFPPWVTMAMINVIGFLFGIATPLFYELGIEITYPIRESYSMGLFTTLYNLANLLMMIPETYMPLNSINGMVTIVFIVTSLTLFAVKEEYKRSKLDAKIPNNAPAVLLHESRPLLIQ